MVSKEFWNNRKVLVTGHTGFKGSWLMEILLYLGAKPFGIGLNPIVSPALFDDLRLKERVNHYYADIRNIESIKKIIEEINPEILIHMAAQPLVIESYKNPIDTFSTNILGTANVLEACRRANNLRAIVSVTTDKVYANTKNKESFTEEDNLGGNDPYSCSKACVELVTQSYFKSFFKDKLNVATARSGNVIGGGDWSKDRLIPDLMRASISKRPLIIRSPEATRPWQHVLEPLFGYLMLAEKLFSGNLLDECEAWNFGPSINQIGNVSQIVRIFSKFLDDPPLIEIEESKFFPETKNLQLNSEKSNLFLKWFPKFNLYETLEYTYDWYYCYLEKGDLKLKTEKQIENYIISGED